MTNKYLKLELFTESEDGEVVVDIVRVVARVLDNLTHSNLVVEITVMIMRSLVMLMVMMIRGSFVIIEAGQLVVDSDLLDVDKMITVTMR